MLLLFRRFGALIPMSPTMCSLSAPSSAAPSAVAPSKRPSAPGGALAPGLRGAGTDRLVAAADWYGTRCDAARVAGWAHDAEAAYLS